MRFFFKCNLEAKNFQYEAVRNSLVSGDYFRRLDLDVLLAEW